MREDLAAAVDRQCLPGCDVEGTVVGVVATRFGKRRGLIQSDRAVVREIGRDGARTATSRVDVDHAAGGVGQLANVDRQVGRRCAPRNRLQRDRARVAESVRFGQRGGTVAVVPLHEDDLPGQDVAGAAQRAAATHRKCAGTSGRGDV